MRGCVGDELRHWTPHDGAQLEKGYENTIRDLFIVRDCVSDFK